MEEAVYVTNDVFWASIRESHVMHLCAEACVENREYEKAEEYFRLSLKLSDDSWLLFRKLNPTLSDRESFIADHRQNKVLLEEKDYTL